MIDKREVAHRFFLCNPNFSPKEIAKKYGVAYEAVLNWMKRETPPWKTLKYLCDSDGVSWDWLLEGVGAMYNPAKKKKKHRMKKPDFSTIRMNHRFLTLFTGLKACDIAAELGVTSSSVSEWRLNKRRVSWKRLEYAVDKFNVRWDWLIDGLEPKYRDSE